MKRIYFACFCLCLTCSFAIRRAQAQTETVLYNFKGGSDGFTPQSGLASDGAGNLYGTTGFGGLGYGTVFELSPNGSGGWNESVIYSFTGGADGSVPYFSYLLVDSEGNLYGTTYWGGTYGYGAVFELSPVGTNWNESVLYSFAGGTEDSNPIGNLVMDKGGNLYGRTSVTEGANGNVFELSKSGGSWTKQVIYNNAADYGGLAMNAAGDIYGVTPETVFELSPNGQGGWNPSVIHTFAGGAGDGIEAEGTPVLDQAGNVYGTTLGGGLKNDGVVYELIHGTKGWTEKILHSFQGGSNDGSDPLAGIVFDAAGNIYGTTEFGGSTPIGGTVYELVAPVGAGSYKERVLWKFNQTDGYEPVFSLMVDSAGNVYGTTSNGGTNNCGVVFKVNVPSTWTTTTLTSLLNPSTYGQGVTFNAVVTSSLGAPPDGETVTFMKGAMVLGTGILSGGGASFTSTTLAAATDSISAMYGGDSKFGYSTSNTVKQVVNKATTMTTLSSSRNPSNFGQSVTFTASVTPQFSGTVQGSVTFYDGTTALKIVSLSGEVARYTTSMLTVGSHSITASYNGNASFIGSSASLTQTVN
jgi:uncharacterized repeat protein (TIGR03803 family)